MCQAKPGRRCSSHAKKRVMTAKRKFDQAKAQGKDISPYEKKLVQEILKYEETPEGLKSLKESNPRRYNKAAIRAKARLTAFKIEDSFKKNDCSVSTNEAGTRTVSLITDNKICLKSSDGKVSEYSSVDDNSYEQHVVVAEKEDVILEVKIKKEEECYSYSPSTGDVTSGDKVFSADDNYQGLPKNIAARIL